MNLQSKSIECYFKITLAGNELSITNNEVHGFLKVFEHIKMKQSWKLIGQKHFRLQLENHVLQK